MNNPPVKLRRRYLGMPDKPACRHCRARVVSRPRGLCVRCHTDPAVRDLYPPSAAWVQGRTGATAEELDALVAEQYPTMPADRDDPDAAPVGDYWRTRRRGVYADHDPEPSAAWEAWGALSNAAGGYLLTDDTSPGAIAEAQREAVREAVAALGAGWTVEAVSDAAVLPAWVVRRRLEELGEG